jgi:hypothetical protein
MTTKQKAAGLLGWVVIWGVVLLASALQYS